ncbi:MAG: DUF5723 family protein [Bacteroidia bacterium]|nr:DUF5723 family protein [Bacteroidia bacterium]
MRKPVNKPLAAAILRRTFAGFSLAVVFLVLLSGKTAAQDNTMYFFHGIPQANQLNPAIIFPCKIYVELPVISSVKLNIRNTGFGFHDAVHTGTGTQGNTYYLDLSSLEKKLSRMNYLRTDMDIDLLGFGLNLKDWFITFGIANHTELRIAYPDDVVSVKDGNWLVDDERANPVSFNGMGIDATNWYSIGISVAREVREGLKLGLRVKYIQGAANINTRSSRLELNTITSPIALEAEMKYRLNASFPVSLGYASNGLVNSVSFEDSFNNIPGDFIFNGNRGVSIDAGTIYDLDEKTQVAISFTDLGFIWWRKNVNNFNASGKYTFSGINLDEYQSDPDPDDFLQALEDSLLQALTAEGTVKSYLTFMSMKVFGGISREIMPNLQAGIMTRTEIYDMRVRPSLTMSLNYKPIPALAASISYTVMNNKLNQVGAGLMLGNRGAQFYLVTDNIPVRFTRYSGSSWMWPYNARMISLRFGFNLMFGCNERDDKQQLRKSGTNTKLCPAYW